MKRLIFHVDMDAFFAAIEQRDNPELRGKPVIIGSLPGTRGVVSTASYEARVYGVGSAMAISQAYKRCPHGVYIKPSMGKYSEVSRQLMQIFSEFTPNYEPLSVDEAFLDMTGTEKLFGTPLETAQKISAAIGDRLNLTGSIGVAPNKLLAKMASDMQKPNGITLVPFEQEQITAFLKPLPIRKLWGIGAKTAERLKLYGVETIGDLQAIPEEKLVNTFGNSGPHFARLRFGIDDRPVQNRDPQKSIGREHTFQEDVRDLAQLKQTLLKLAGEVSARTRKKGLKGRTITLTYRESNFQRRSVSRTLPHTIDSTYEMLTPVIEMLEQKWPSIGAVRLIGLSISGFYGEESTQLSLFSEEEEAESKENWNKADQLLDIVSKKFGKGGMFRGGEV